MDKVTGKLTVYFDDPFWVGVFEKNEGNKLSVAKVTFGAEPENYDVYEFILEHYYDLQFSPAVKASAREEKRNPKSKQRNARKIMQEKGVGTKSQQALKQQYEQNKQERKVKNREEKAAKEQRVTVVSVAAVAKYPDDASISGYLVRCIAKNTGLSAIRA